MKVGDLVKWWDSVGVIVKLIKDPTWGEVQANILWINGKKGTVNIKYLESANENR